MQVTIEKLDHSGRGIGYIDGKIIFIPKTFVGDIVDVEIVKEKKNYLEGNLKYIIKKSKNRINAPCPYYSVCGGCDLQHMDYEKTIEYKKNNLKNIFKKINLEIEPIVIKNKEPYYYRNKIELKVLDGKIGYYKEQTHNIISIEKCLIANHCINKVLKSIFKLDIKNGNITIRCNNKDEILIIINTEEKINIKKLNIKDNKIIGIILNNKLIYGQDVLAQNIKDLVFQYSFDSFFQVNPYITTKLFDIVLSNIDNDTKVLDLYCGVGTLSIVASQKASNVVGVEIIPNAIKNAITNAKINNSNNTHFLLNDVAVAIEKVGNDFDTIIVDPPRKGLDNKTIEVIKNIKPQKIIYVSCNPHTLVRDLKELIDDYNLTDSYILDMFSYTYHCESFNLLTLKC